MMQDIQWVTSDPAQFITWGSDIKHYTVVPLSPDTLPNHDHVLNESHAAVHVSTVQEPQFVRCVDIWPGDGVLLAAGQVNTSI